MSEQKSAAELATEAKALFERRTDEVKAIAEKALEEGKRGISMSETAKELADQAITFMTEAKARLDDIEQKAARPEGDDKGIEVKSYGQQLAENEALQRYVATKQPGGISIELKAITTANNSAGGLIQSRRETDVIDLPKRPDIIMRDLVTVIPTTNGSIDYPRQVARTNNARAVAEGTGKPYSEYTWGKVSTPVRTLAHLAKLTRQAMQDAPQLQAEVDAEMRYGLALAEDQQILLGDGTGENLNGLYTQATAYALPTGATAPTTAVDKLRAAELMATLNLYPVTAFVLNPVDWFNIETLKDGEGRYLFGGPQQVAGPGLWGKPVVPTVSMTAGNFLTGDFKRAATLYDRMTVEVLISSENADDFEKNLLTMRAEERLALAVKRPAALIKGPLAVA